MRVGIVDAGVPAPLEALWTALEKVFPVRFEKRDAGDVDGLDALVVLGGGSAPAGLPALIVGPGTPVRARSVVFADGAAVPAPFRGRRVGEHGPVGTVEAEPGDEVLATCDRRPVWLKRLAAGETVFVSTTPLEAPPAGASLRSLFRAGRFMPLLPLVHLLRAALERQGWSGPPLRAAFMFDDPNLHWTSYGYIRFNELAAHARERGYHVSMAMVPRDGWYAQRAAARLFRDNRRQMSLLVHGNDHVRHELGRARTAEEVRAVATQAAERMTSFERRTGVTVDRVMAPPHGRCSEEMLPALLEAGFEALCIGEGQPWLQRAPDGDVREWRPADLVHGLPVVSRLHFAEPRDDLPFQAYLGRPLVLYGHHTDVASGLDVLDNAAAEIDSLGQVKWLPLGDVVAANFETQRRGDTLRVRLFARRARLSIPPGVTAIAVELPSAGEERGEREAPKLAGEELSFSGSDATARLAGHGGELTIRARPPQRLSPAPMLGSRRPWALSRRVATEVRDRALPVVRRGGRAA